MQAVVRNAWNYVKNSDAKEFIIATEKGVVDRLKRDYPDKEFILIKNNLVCPDMKLNTLQDIYDALANEEYEITVALISHGYNIYDERVSMKIFDKLEKLGVKVLTYEQLTQGQLEEGLNALGIEKAYWANETEMTGAAGHYLRNTKADGLITITAFGCGPDSIMVDRIFRNAKKFEKPILGLTLDEHTGEAGFVTRLEAFIDMLSRKKRADIKKKETLNNSDEQTAIPKRPNFENIPIK